MMLYGMWLSLPDQTTKLKVAKVFNIPQKVITHTDSNRVVVDGFLVEDIERAITMESMQGYLDSKETSVEKLWQMMVDKVLGRIVVQEEVVVVPVIIEESKQETNEAKIKTTVKRRVTKRTKK